jgi:glutathione S-transferase
MHTVYTRKGTGGFVVEAALLLAGEPFERIEMIKGEQPDPVFLKLSPLNQVPVLVLPDGSSMTETAAMCIHLAERYPKARLAPAAGEPGRADFLRWLGLMNSVIYPAVLRYYYAPRYTSDEHGSEGVKQGAIAEMDRGLAVLDEVLRERQWLVGERMTIDDVYLLMMFYWHPEIERAKANWQNVDRACAVLRDHPVMKELNAWHELW